MARQFARLKLRLIRNGLRSGQYATLFLIGAAGAGVLAFLGFVSLAALRTDRAGPDATLVAFAGVTAAWAIVPLMGFGTDETLDPQRLALLPLRRSQLLGGLLVAALVGVAPVATAAGLSGALIGLAHDPVQAVLVLAAIAATLLLCVVSSRVLIALLAPLLRSRRGRDFMIMTFTLAIFAPQALRLFAAHGHSHDVRHVFAQIASRVRYTPFGLGGLAATEAGKGRVAASLAALAACATIIVLLLALWSYLIPRAMTTADLAPAQHATQSRRTSNVPLYPRWLPFLPRTRTGAVTAKELRYFARDPRRRGPLIAALVVPALFLFSTLRDPSTARPAATTLLALVALLPASGLTLNQFGLDGAALWGTVVAGNDPQSDLTGKNLATALLVVPLITVPAVVTAAVVHGWQYLPLTLGIAPGMLGIVLGVGDVVSAYAPYALPDRRNPLAANPGQGCVGALAALGALVADALVMLPPAVVTIVAVLTAPLAVATVVGVGSWWAYGTGIWLAGRRAATRRLWWRMPELLEAVSPRQAG